MKIEEYANTNEMKLNYKKTKFMVFNPTINFDFIPDFELGGNQFETSESMKLLGLELSNDLSWKKNTESMIKKAYSKLWMIKRLIKNGASLEDLTDVYVKQVRSILEFGVPVWNSGIKKEQVTDIERVQKSFLHIVLGTDYQNYQSALKETSLETLESRRTKLCLNFAKKAAKYDKHSHWFVPTDPAAPDTRSEKMKYKPPLCRLQRFQTSPIPYLTNLLNTA